MGGWGEGGVGGRGGKEGGERIRENVLYKTYNVIFFVVVAQRCIYMGDLCGEEEWPKNAEMGGRGERY